MKTFQLKNIATRISFLNMIIIWFLYFVLYTLLKHYGLTLCGGLLELVVTVGLDIIIALLAFCLWNRTIGSEKLIFALFGLSFLLAAVDDAAYSLIVNVLGITNYPIITAFLFEIPFMGFLILQLWAWIFIFLKSKPTRNNNGKSLISFLPIVMMGIIIFIVFSLSSFSWKFQTFSLIGLCRGLEALMQILNFIFAVLCLSMGIDRQIRFIATGFLVVMACCFASQLSHLMQTLVVDSYLEIVWAFGLLLIIFGFYEMLKNPSDLKAEKWLARTDSVQAQCAFWSFLLCMTSLMTFWSIGYMFAGDNIIFKSISLQDLPAILIIFSMFAVLISLIFARTYSAPFRRMEIIINSYLQERDIDLVQEQQASGIYEFEQLEKFLTKAFEVLKERNKAQSDLANCAVQVAHDVRRPFTMIKSLLGLLPSLNPAEIKKHSETVDITLRKVDSLLDGITDYAREEKYDLIAGNIISALDLSIKDVSSYNPDKKVDFYYQLEILPLVNLDELRICRAFENIIANAFDFLPEKEGFMWFSAKMVKNLTAPASGHPSLTGQLRSESFDGRGGESFVEIVIGNSHSHIPEDKIEHLFEKMFTSGKKKGTGLGLGIVKKVINGHNGKVFARNVEEVPKFVACNPKNFGTIKFGDTKTLLLDEEEYSRNREREVVQQTTPPFGSTPSLAGGESQHIGGVEFVITLPLTKTPGHELKDPLLENSTEAKIVPGMIEKEDQLAGASEVSKLTEELKHRRPKLLILDDESLYRMHVRDVLKKLGELNKYVSTYDANSYKEAIDILNHTKIDFLICDIDLMDARNNGFSVLSEAISKSHTCRVLIHTNRKDPQDIKQAKKLGACGFCPKPITEAILVDLLLEKDLWLEAVNGRPTLGELRPTGERLTVNARSDLTKNHQQSTNDYIKGIPNSVILLVNDDAVTLQYEKELFEKLIDPKDNITVYTALSYKNAVEIINKEKVDILISDLNLKTTETGLDICKYLKQKNVKALCVISSAIGNNACNKLKEENKDWIDEAIYITKTPQDILDLVFKSLKKKNDEYLKTLNQDDILRELISYALSIIYPEIEAITEHVRKIPELIKDIAKLKTESAPTVQRMFNMEDKIYAFSDYIDKDKIPDKRFKLDIAKVDTLLNLIQDDKIRSEIIKKYSHFLDFLRHDIVGAVITVRSFFTDIDYVRQFKNFNGFAIKNVQKQNGANESAKALVAMLKTSPPDKLDLQNMERQIGNIIKKFD